MPSEPSKTIAIRSDVIELSQILKFEGLVSSGGEAKQAIADGQVLVNGDLESRKRRKIIPGDTIEFRGQSYRVAGPKV